MTVKASLIMPSEGISCIAVFASNKLLFQFESEEKMLQMSKRILDSGLILRDAHKPSSIDDYFPDEMLYEVFTRLTFRSLQRASLVSRRWKKISEDSRLGFKQYLQLRGVIWPDKEQRRTITKEMDSRLYKSDYLTVFVNCYGVNFIEDFNKPLKIDSKQETHKTPKALCSNSQDKEFDPDDVLFESRLIKGNFFEKADFCIQEYHRIGKGGGWGYFVEKTGVLTFIRNPNLSDRQKKLIAEIQDDSPVILKENTQMKAQKCRLEEQKVVKKQKIDELGKCL